MPWANNDVQKIQQEVDRGCIIQFQREKDNPYKIQGREINICRFKRFEYNKIIKRKDKIIVMEQRLWNSNSIGI